MTGRGVRGRVCVCVSLLMIVLPHQAQSFPSLWSTIPSSPPHNLLPYLYRGHRWWQNQSCVITMHHRHDTNATCGEPPGVLVCKVMFSFLQSWAEGNTITIATTTHLPRNLKLDVEHFREVLTKVMWGGSLCNNTWKLVQQVGEEPYLYAPPTSRDESLDGGGVVSTCKLLFLCLLPGDNRYGQQFLIHTTIQIQYDHNLCVCVCVCVCMRVCVCVCVRICVTFINLAANYNYRDDVEISIC